MAREMTSSPRETRTDDPILTGLVLLLVVLMPTQRSIKANVTPADLVLGLAFVWLVGSAVWRFLLRRPNRPSLLWPPVPFWIYLFVAGLSCLRLPSDLEHILQDAGSQYQAPLRILVAKEILQTVELFFIAPLVLVNGLRTRRMTAVAACLLVGVTCLVVLWGGAQAGSHGSAEAVRATFGSRLAYGGFLAVALPLVWALALGLSAPGGAMRMTLISVGLCAMVFVGLYSMPAFGPFWAAALGLVVVSSALPGSAGARWGRTAAALVLIVVPWALAPHRSEFRTPSVALQVTNEDGEKAIADRYAEWQAAHAMTMANEVGGTVTQEPGYPLYAGGNAVVGLGPGRYQDKISTYGEFLPVNKIEADSQNQYLVIAPTLGLTGVFAFAILLGEGVRSGVRGREDETNPPLARVVSAGLVGSLASLAVACLYLTALVRGLGLVVMLVLVMAMTLGPRPAEPPTPPGPDGE
ncbi:MAG TPA: hypothetical protein PLQ54_07670 [Armatimonadota bacterium]|nr:hypothetical protein [Armatimonadota bacterium]